MSKRISTFLFALSGLTLGALAASGPARVAGFGPAVSDDPTLNASLGVLEQVMAWQNSPYGDVFQTAQATTAEDNFENVAILSSASEAQGRWLAVRDDATLDRGNGALSQMIAWQNSPSGDAFLVARADPEVKGADFERIALASIPSGAVLGD